MFLPPLWKKIALPAALLSCLALVSAVLIEGGEKSMSAPTSAAMTAGGQKLPLAKSGKEAEQAPLPRLAPVALSNRITEYHINVRLNAAAKKLEAQQTLTWTNPGSLPVDELYVHLYPNAFASKKTTFMAESKGRLRNDRMPKDGYGNIELLAMSTDDGQDLLPGKKFVQPDDGNEHDQTLMMVRLNRPVPPKAKITLHFQYVVQLPKIFARMGYAGDFVMAAQWFPKISVYEPAGTRNRKAEGWNLHQYHGNSEFYADFGIYNVAITVPKAYTVAATGFPAKISETAEGWKTYRFYADDVHDFAWAASPDFIYAEQPFSAPGVPGVKIRLYLDPKHEHLQERYLTAVKKSLADYSHWYGEYPYSTLSVVVPPSEANGAGGMEYPTLITSWGATDPNPDRELERVIVHEIGHQYFYGMVATNEFEEAWLDEGLTSYAEAKVMEKEYAARTNFPLESSYLTNPRALNLNAWQYKRHTDYADNVYIRAKLVLTAIEREIGGEQMEQVLRTYVQRWKFRHPTTADFLAALEQTTGTEWDDFFKTYVYAGTMADVSVDGIQIRQRPEQGGVIYDSTVIVTKRAGIVGQVPVLIRFADGNLTTKLWDGSSGAHFTLSGSAPVEWAMVDPNYTLVLENKHINNFFKASVDSVWKTRWSIGIVKLIETLLQGVAW